MAPLFLVPTQGILSRVSDMYQSYGNTTGDPRHVGDWLGEILSLAAFEYDEDCPVVDEIIYNFVEMEVHNNMLMDLDWEHYQGVLYSAYRDLRRILTDTVYTQRARSDNLDLVIEYWDFTNEEIGVRLKEYHGNVNTN